MTEIEEETAIVTVSETEIGVEVAIASREVLATSISRTLGASAGATGAARRMEEITDTATPSASDQLAATIAGRNPAEMIAGKTTAEMTGWEAVEDGTRGAAEAEEARSTGRSLLPEMNDWNWSYSVLAILALISANTRISRSMPPVRTYRHTSHL